MESKTKAGKVTFHIAQWKHLLTAQVAFLSEGDPQVAVPSAEAVSQERRKG